VIFVADWGPLVDVVGFCFLNLASGYKPPEDMVKWLAAGKPPIYVGFGSLVSFFLLARHPMMVTCCQCIENTAAEIRGRNL
jgi:UDP:flavonoid glycosyltransferase YjiC (YdhE family)